MPAVRKSRGRQQLRELDISRVEAKREERSRHIEEQDHLAHVRAGGNRRRSGAWDVRLLLGAGRIVGVSRGVRPLGERCVGYGLHAMVEPCSISVGGFGDQRPDASTSQNSDVDMNDDVAQMQQLLGEVGTCLEHGRRRQTIEKQRRLAAIAATLALTLQLRSCR